MLKIAVICIFGLCLLQFAHALPVDKHESSDVAVAQRSAAVVRVDSPSSEEELTPREQLLLTVMVEGTLFPKLVVEEGRVLFQDTLKELNALPDKSEVLQANMTRLADFVKETKDLDIKKDPNDVKKSFSAMLRMTEILQDFDDMSDDDKLTHDTLEAAFEKAGWEKFENEFEKRIINFITNFEEAFKAFICVAPEEDKDPQLISLFDKLVAEKDTEKKMDIFNELSGILK